jgi:hypothetical protein
MLLNSSRTTFVRFSELHRDLGQEVRGRLRVWEADEHMPVARRSERSDRKANDATIERASDNDLSGVENRKFRYSSLPPFVTLCSTLNRGRAGSRALSMTLKV